MADVSMTLKQIRQCLSVGRFRSGSWVEAADEGKEVGSPGRRFPVAQEDVWAERPHSE